MGKVERNVTFCQVGCIRRTLVAIKYTLRKKLTAIIDFWRKLFIYSIGSKFDELSENELWKLLFDLSEVSANFPLPRCRRLQQ